MGKILINAITIGSIDALYAPKYAPIRKEIFVSKWHLYTQSNLASLGDT